MVSCVNKKSLFCISLPMCLLRKGICRLIITSLQPGIFHHSISAACINREKTLHPASLLCSFRPREAGNLHIYHPGTLVRGENITHSHKNSHISYLTTAVFQCDGWLKPNKVVFTDEPQPSGLFIRFVKLDPTGFSSSSLNMCVVLIKSRMLLMCFKYSLLDPCLYNDWLHCSIGLNEEGIYWATCMYRCHAMEVVASSITQIELGVCCELGSNRTGFSSASVEPLPLQI